MFRSSVYQDVWVEGTENDLGSAAEAGVDATHFQAALAAKGGA
jgi:hypothetical protein